MLTTRPKVAELALQLFGRSVHPELFNVCRTHVVERAEYTAKLAITSAGHVITWNHKGLTLTEVAAPLKHPLPKKRRLLSYELSGQGGEQLACRGGAQYRVWFELETLAPDTFRALQRQLAQADEQKGLLFNFDGSSRMASGGVSYLHVESRSRSLLVQTVHTFPAEYALVKCESLFETP